MNQFLEIEGVTDLRIRMYAFGGAEDGDFRL
jgi:hypothetical protein